MAINAFYSAADVLFTCRLLATLLGVMQNVNAVTLNTTEDGLSVTGMFFTKLEAIRARNMRGEEAMVRL
jgi:hypothetical protein